MTPTDSDMRAQLVTAAIAHVPFDGWSHETLSLAAAECGLSDTQWHDYFPGGLDEVVELYGALADDKMVSAYHEMDQVPAPTHLKVRTLILLRLHQARGHSETVRRSLGFLARPQHAALATKMLYRTVDAIWRAAGDTTTDYNFYTKRATLAAVYSATMLAFLADDTDDLAKTEAFLDRRLKDVSRIPKMAKPAQVFVTGLASVVSRATGMMGRRPFRW